MNKVTDGSHSLDEITAFTTSIRCKVIPDVDEYTGTGFVIDIPPGSSVKGKDIGGFRIALYPEEGHRSEEWIKKRRVKDKSKLHVSLEDDGYVRFAIRR